jgi:hypothetical protein
MNEEDIDDPTVLDDTRENKEQDVRRAMLHAINGIADLHERINWEL